MIHPTRTNLLLLREKSRSVANSVAILKARRQALLREFLASSRPFVRSREEVRDAYGRGIGELSLTLGIEGSGFVESVAGGARRDLPLDIAERSVMGLRYRDVTVHDSPVRSPEARGYDHRHTTPHLEEAIQLFETIIAEMLELAAFESRLLRLGNEIRRVTRRIRVLEERVLPGLRRECRSIAQYLGEREREAYYRLKQFKELRLASAGDLNP